MHRVNRHLSVPLREVQYETCSFGFDVLACPRCAGRLRLIALIEQASVIQRILRHLGLPTEIPTPLPARSPPLPLTARAWYVEADATAFEPC